MNREELVKKLKELESPLCELCNYKNEGCDIEHEHGMCKGEVDNILRVLQPYLDQQIKEALQAYELDHREQHLMGLENARLEVKEAYENNPQFYLVDPETFTDILDDISEWATAHGKGKLIFIPSKES